MLKKTFTIMLSALCCTALLTACGGNSSSSSESTEENTEATADDGALKVRPESTNIGGKFGKACRNNVDFIRKSVKNYVSSCNGRHFVLNLNRSYRICAEFSRKKNGNNSAARADIEYSVPFPHRNAVCKQYRIRRETIPVGILNEFQSVYFEVVDALVCENLSHLPLRY